MKKSIAMILCLLLAASMLAGCGTEKYDVSVPYSFQESGPVQNVTIAPEPQEAPAEPVPEAPAEVPEEIPAEIPEDVTAEVPEDTAEAVLPLSDAEISEEPAEVPPEVVPDEEPEPDVYAAPAFEDEIGPAGDEVMQPYALDGEDDVQRFGSPAEEAEWLDAEAALFSDAPDTDVLEEEAPFFEEPAEEAPLAEEAYEPSEEDLQFADDVTAQAFAVAMAYWDSGYGVETSPSDPKFAWEALGWYAAWLYRTEGLDLLSAETVETFLQSLSCTDMDAAPADVMDYGAPRVLRSRDGVCYDFAWYKDHLDEVLGVEAEFTVKPVGLQAVDAVVTQHFDGGLEAAKAYTLTYDRNDQPESELGWLLQSVTLPEFAPEVDPALTFTWADVAQANRLENVLAIYPAVRIYSVEYPDSGSTWVFQRNGNPALVVEGSDYCSGQYMGCWFDYDADENGVVRARIGGLDPDAGNWESLNDTLLEGFRDASALRLDRIEKDLIWADCLYRGGFRQKLAFDRGTLVLRELVVLSEEGEVFGSNRYDYSASEPEFAFLDGWDKTLRDVTVTWENYENGEQILFTETVSIPVDWEYLPYEGRWGDYIIYNNTEYLGEYEYPGDDVDYELFLTTVKG
ncbi:MAG: hypothetical protein J6Z15_03290 [Oscillospiraceae bacterium]|nr:hypothetical protein [Oscillospiraceae bacterium]